MKHVPSSRPTLATRASSDRFSGGVGGGTSASALAGALFVTASLLPLAAVAQTVEDASAACTEAARLIGEGDTDGAMEEAEWCVESLRQVRRQRTQSVFPDAVAGFVGGELDNQSAMGMTMMERTYASDAGEIGVTLATGAAGAGLAALAQMGMNLGAAGGGRKLRIQKRTVVDMSEEEGQAQYMVQLKSGGMLTVSSPTVPSEDVLEFVRAFPIVELDEALSP